MAQAIHPLQRAGERAGVAERLARYQRPGTLAIEPPPLSLYVHLPWCLAKCPYCDFNSHAAAPATVPQRRYVDALIADLEASLPFVWGRRVHTVFIGGGTPSLFDPSEIERLVAAIRARLPLEPAAEITLEANPGSFESERFAAYRAAGVTRLSIGVQSFDDDRLRALGRVHDAAQARAAVAEAASAFDTFNIDLMFALPGQTVDGAARDVDEGLAFAPPHLSLYQLAIEPNTLFAARPPSGLPDDEAAWDMQERAIARLEAGGLGRYEVSAYARAGHRARHNLNYWRFGDYLGIGAGAHGKLSFAHRAVRQLRLRDPQAWMLGAEAGDAVASEHEIARAELPFEFMLNALRLVEGFAFADFTARTGLAPTAIEAPLAAAERRGLLQRDWQRARPTPRGYELLNDLVALFLPAGPARASTAASVP